MDGSWLLLVLVKTVNLYILQTRYVVNSTRNEQVKTSVCLRPSGVQRSGDAWGDCLIGCPLPNSGIEQWRMVVIVTG